MAFKMKYGGGSFPFKKTYDPNTGMWSEDDKDILNQRHTSLVDEGMTPGTKEYNKIMDEVKQDIVTHDSETVAGGYDSYNPGQTLADVKDPFEPKYVGDKKDQSGKFDY